MNVVIATYGTTGDIQPLLGLSAELRKRGHSCKFAAPPNFAARVKRLGFEFIPLGPALDTDEFREVYGRAFLSTDPVQHVRRTLPLVLRDTPRMVTELASVCRGADVLLSLPYQLAGAIVHELLGIPLISVHLSPFGGYSRRFTAETERPINELRASYGFAPVSDPLGPGGSASLLTIYAVSPVLFPRPRRWPEHCQLTGFFFLEEDSTPDPALARFIDGGEPPVAFSFGSMVHSSPHEVAKIVLEAIERVGTRAIVQRGWTDLRFDTAPAHIYVADFVPHQWLFPKVSCVVHAGGAGTTAAVLRAGAPSVVVPHMLDQFIWAALLQERGCSTDGIPFPELTAARLANALERARDPLCRERVAVISERLSAENGTARAADLIELHVQPKRKGAAL